MIIGELVVVGASTLTRLLADMGPRRRTRLALRVLAQLETECLNLQRALSPSVASGDHEALAEHNELTARLKSLRGSIEVLEAQLAR